MRASAQHAWGDPTLRGRKVGIAGVGKVGHLLVEHLLQDGAEVVITDVRAESVDRVRTKFPQVTAVADTEALIRTEGLDVYAPCALGGALSDESVPVLTAKVVCGAANNQLAHPGIEKELSDRGILYAPDYVVNAAWCHPGGRRAARLRLRPLQDQGREDLRHHTGDIRSCEGRRHSARRGRRPPGRAAHGGGPAHLTEAGNAALSAGNSCSRGPPRVIRETSLTTRRRVAVQDRLKSQLTSGDGAPCRSCRAAGDAGDVPYGRGSRYR